MKFLKYLKIIGTVLFVVVILAFILLIHRIYPLLGSNTILMPNSETNERILKNNYEELSNVCEYMLDLDYYYVRYDIFDSNKLTYHKQSDGDVHADEMKIEDPAILSNLKKLQNANIEIILKNDNYILFINWSSLDSSCGLLYCCENKPNITGYGNILLEELSTDGWYYYRHITD